MKTNPGVDKYLIDGCMRCKYGATTQCKVNFWKEELLLLRGIALESKLKEEIKWGIPVYTLNGKNIFNISALKESVIMGFYKGAIMKDPKNLLTQQGNIQAARIIRFLNVDDIVKNKKNIIEYIKEAIEIEKSGKKPAIAKNPEPQPLELLAAMEEDAMFREAFTSLTPGKQRGYNIYFAHPKQSTTRVERIKKYKEQILKGIGLHDKYKSQK